MNKEIKSNRLVHEQSPYLLQHAHQPVDWYPWGEEAFELSEREQKPIFLSIGYSSCHWCHVMAHEAFEEFALAQQMNQLFVNIKVDREEHPEVDALYMRFAQVMIRGATGWPLTIVTTPHRAPFFAATYLPIHSQQGQMGMYELVSHIRVMFEGQEKATIISEANKMVATLQMLNIEELRGSKESGKLPTLTQIPSLISLLFALADPVFGGLKGEPKFPLSYQNDFLLAYAVEESDPRALFLAERTLEKMALGGIYDQLGGGFARYSVDDEWHIPHFEKMLTDQALLIQSYLYGWQVYQKPFFERVCRETCDFLLRDMRAKEGAFYTSQDADSEGQEGYFYLWSRKEIEAVFPNKIEAERICQWFGMGGGEEEKVVGKTVLYCPKSLEEFALSQNLSAASWLESLSSIKRKLFAKRKERSLPLMDETILTAANGFAIHSLFCAGKALQEERYVQAALEAMEAVRRDFWKEGRLLRWRCQGESKYAAQLDDYAAITRACLTLFEGTGQISWLNWAIEMVEIVQKEYGSGLGGYYLTNGGDPYLLFRPIEYTDGAQPSGNAIHCENLLRLAQITRQAHYQREAEEILKACSLYLAENPLSVMYHAWNILRFLSKGAPLLVFAYEAQGESEQERNSWLTHRFLPFSTVIWKREGDAELLERLPFLRECVPVKGQSTLYIYEEGTCKQRCAGSKEIVEAIQTLSIKHFLHPVLHR